VTSRRRSSFRRGLVVRYAEDRGSATAGAVEHLLDLARYTLNPLRMIMSLLRSTMK
jgi:hypothetical protein